MKTSKMKKRMSSGSCITSKLYDKIIKTLSKFHETIPLSAEDGIWTTQFLPLLYLPLEALPTRHKITHS
jgi:hypothetical protein